VDCCDIPIARRTRFLRSEIAGLEELFQGRVYLNKRTHTNAVADACVITVSRAIGQIRASKRTGLAFIKAPPFLRRVGAAQSMKLLKWNETRKTIY
jgi:hypothetical protein